MAKESSPDPCDLCKSCTYQKYGFIAFNVWGLIILAIITCIFWNDCKSWFKKENEDLTKTRKNVDPENLKSPVDPSGSENSGTIKTQLSTTGGPAVNYQLPLIQIPPSSPPLPPPPSSPPQYSQRLVLAQPPPPPPLPPPPTLPIASPSTPNTDPSRTMRTTTIIHARRNNPNQMPEIIKFKHYNDSTQTLPRMNSGFMPASIQMGASEPKQNHLDPPSFQTLLPQPIQSPESPKSPKSPQIPIEKHESTGSNYFKQIMKGRKPVLSISQYANIHKKQQQKKKEHKKGHKKPKQKNTGVKIVTNKKYKAGTPK